MGDNMSTPGVKSGQAGIFKPRIEKGKMNMNRALAIALICLGLIVSSCDTPSGSSGGGGLFGGGGGAVASNIETWDIMFMLNPGTTVCPQGFYGRGAVLNPMQQNSFFPGVAVYSLAGEYDADVPEIMMLGYYLGIPGLVPPGANVHVHFIYQANADGLNGDYFMARITDGSRYLVPARPLASEMAAGFPMVVDFEYIAQGGFGMEFIVGLSGPTDTFYLDELLVSVNGITLFVDYFESGTYNLPGQLPPGVMRNPFVAANAVGTMGLSPAVVLEGAQSLSVTGGRYFQLYGQGAAGDGFSGIVLTYNDPDFLNPFFGQTQAMLQGSVYLGDYLAFDNATVPNCIEQGNVMISVNPVGNIFVP